MTDKPGLYLVSTPIGNLEDITLRALRILKKSRIIYCENSNVSKTLFTHYDIHTKIKIYNDYSTTKEREEIKNCINNGALISLVSDAGSPLVSDPGYKLINYLKNSNCHIDVIPGASAVITALSISTLPTNIFTFGGFIPKTIVCTENFFLKFIDIKSTLIFFETAKRLDKTLKIAYKVFGNKKVCIARELTKIHQNIHIDSLENLTIFYQDKKVKGEIVLLISNIFYKDNNLEELHNIIKLYLTKGLTAKTTTELLYIHYQKSYDKKKIYSIVNKIKTKISNNELDNSIT